MVSTASVEKFSGSARRIAPHPGAGDEAHLLRAHRELRHDGEQHHGADEGGGGHRALNGGEHWEGRSSAQIAAGLDPGQRQEPRDPDRAGSRCDEVGRARGRIRRVC